MESKQRVMVGTDATRQRLVGDGLVKHAADTDAIDVSPVNTEADDTASENIHHQHHPMAAQDDRLKFHKGDQQVDGEN